jgi:hypothetical protein
MAGETTPPARPDPLVMPADEFAVVTRAWRAWVDGPLREAFDRLVQEIADDAAGPWRDRAEAAEAKLADVRAVLLEGGQDHRTVRRRALAVIGTEEERRD